MHGLVAEAFLGRRPEGMLVFHGPRGKECNEVGNISYGRQSALTEGQVKEIKESDERAITLARRLGVDKSAISHIRAGRRWAHVS